jgi:hypothetical protein
MWIVREWRCISPEVIVKGFTKFWISSAVNETDDYMFCHETEENGNVRECEGDEGTDYEDADSDTGW